MRTVESAFRHPFISGVTPRREMTQRSIVRAVVRETEPAVRPVSGPSSLTAREVEVIQLQQQGLTYRQIGERLGISPNTVKAHLSSVFAKLRDD